MKKKIKQAVNLDGWKRVMMIMGGKFWMELLIHMWKGHNGATLHELAKETGFPLEMCSESLLYLERNSLIVAKNHHYFVNAHGKFVVKMLLDIKANVNDIIWTKILS